MEEVEVLASYETDYYEGVPAVTRREYGEGKAYYLACETEDGFLSAFYGKLIQELGIAGEFTGKLPYGVAVSKREGNGEFWFIQNFNREETQLELPFAAAVVPEGTPLEGSVTLKPYECLVLKRA